MKRRNLIYLFAVLVIFFALFLVPSPISRESSDFIIRAIEPVSKSLVATGKRVADIFSLLAEIGGLRRENQRLSGELVISKSDSAKMEELEIENNNLKQQLEYKEKHPEMGLTLANVVGLDPTNFYDTIIVDKGANDGISLGMAVISLGTLVGKIDQVSPDSSRVILITSKDSIIQAMLESSRTAAVLKGGISGMTLENIPIDTVVAENENVITSGLGGKLPKGIFIGNAGREISSKSAIFKTLEVGSVINFAKLEMLFIVTKVGI